MKMTNYNIKTLYYLLYAKYGSSHINSDNPTQWKYKIFSNIFAMGPTWKQKGELQEILHESSIDDLQKGAIQINNTSANPDGLPINPTGSTVDKWDSIGGVNTQGTFLNKSGKLTTISNTHYALKNDTVGWFIKTFQKYFIIMTAPAKPLWYPEIGYDPEEIPFDNYITNTFEEIWPTYEDFYADYINCGIPTTI